MCTVFFWWNIDSAQPNEFGPLDAPYQLLFFYSFLTANLLACLMFLKTVSFFWVRVQSFSVNISQVDFIDRTQNNLTPLYSETSYVSSVSSPSRSFHSFPLKHQNAGLPPTGNVFNSMLLFLVSGRFLNLIFSPISISSHFLIFQLFFCQRALMRK